MENLMSEEEKIIKVIRNLFGLKKELNDTAIKDIKNIFRLKKQIKRIKDIAFRNIKNLFEYEKGEESYYKPVRVNNFWSNNYIEHKCNSDKNKIRSVEEYLHKIRPYLKGIINNLEKSGTSKIQLIKTIIFF